MRDYLPLLAVLLSLLFGLVVGKAWERYKLRDGRWIDRRRLRETPHYMLGLNFLVDNQVDQAIDELMQATSMGTTDALEIQMILGNLYRAKGQVGRAINVHQQLLQRPDLTRLEQAYVQLCLALDFRNGGFVDRPPGLRDAVHRGPLRRHAGEEPTTAQRRNPHAVRLEQARGFLDAGFGDLVAPQPDPADARRGAAGHRLGQRPGLRGDLVEAQPGVHHATPAACSSGRIRATARSGSASTPDSSASRSSVARWVIVRADSWPAIIRKCR